MIALLYCAKKKHLFESNKNPWLKNTDVLEIRALLGLIYFRGLYNVTITALIICFQRKWKFLYLQQQCQDKE